MSDWEALAEWWLGEASDPVYANEVFPLVHDLMGDVDGDRVLELGAGEGQILRLLRERGAEAVGLDVSPLLAARAGSSFVGRLPSLGAVHDYSFDTTLVVMVLEHLPALNGLFEECHRVTRRGGSCVVVANHPLMTAPGAAPITDPTDGEVFIRTGDYFRAGYTEEPTQGGTVRFHHRPLGQLLERAAATGWNLQRFVEQPVSQATIEHDSTFAGQATIPRLVGIRWAK